LLTHPHESFLLRIKAIKQLFDSSLLSLNYTPIFCTQEDHLGPKLWVISCYLAFCNYFLGTEGQELFEKPEEVLLIRLILFWLNDHEALSIALKIWIIGLNFKRLTLAKT
jgi:hypothetical protein